MKAIPGENGENILERQNSHVITSVAMLESKIEIMINVLQDMAEGKRPYNMKLARIAKAIIQARNRYVLLKSRDTK